MNKTRKVLTLDSFDDEEKWLHTQEPDAHPWEDWISKWVEVKAIAKAMKHMPSDWQRGGGRNYFFILLKNHGHFFKLSEKKDNPCHEMQEGKNQLDKAILDSAMNARVMATRADAPISREYAKCGKYHFKELQASFLRRLVVGELRVVTF